MKQEECVSLLSPTHLTEQLEEGRKASFPLTVSGGFVHDRLTPCFWACAEARHHGKGILEEKTHRGILEESSLP